MAQIKAPKVNWLDEAWGIAEVIGPMPRHRLNMLAKEGKGPPLEDKDRESLEELQDLIGVHLAYRLCVTYKLKSKQTDSPLYFNFRNRDPVKTLRRLKDYQAAGITFKAQDLWAFSANIMLGRILIDRYVCTEWKIDLPLSVASISGQSVSQAAKVKARQTRNVDRRSSLSMAVATERRNYPRATAYEVLNRLTGGEVVSETKNDRVYYWQGDKMKSVGLDRFETIFSEQKPSTG